MASYTTVLQALSQLPSTLHTTFFFILAAFRTITPSVIIALAYRLMVLYSAARIIPAIRSQGASEASLHTQLDDSDGVNTAMTLLSSFSPSILIAVYTSLLMQHFASAASDWPGESWTMQGGQGGEGNVWRWVNLAGTMSLYALELWLGKRGEDGLGVGVGGHWKLD